MKVDEVSLQGEQVFKAKMPVSARLEIDEIFQDSPPTAQIDEPSPTDPHSCIIICGLYIHFCLRVLTYFETF